MNARLTCAALALGALAGCAPDDPGAPPDIVYGDAVCDFCNMIISDERFACATIVLDERARSAPRLFDDLNCQAMDEAARDGETIVARWVHDHATGEWTRAESATFVASPTLRTPMASNTAAFADRARAVEAAQEWGASTLDFAGAWAALAPDHAQGQEPEP